MTEREDFEARYAGVHFSKTFMNGAWDGWSYRAAFPQPTPQAALVAAAQQALIDNRDSWREQASQRVADAVQFAKERDHYKALYEAVQAAPVAAEPSDAEIALSALNSGEWGLVRNLPNDCFTDNANLRHAWSVRRLVPPYCADRHDSERQWSGPTARQALQTASDDLDVPLPAALAVSPAPQAAPVAAIRDQPFGYWHEGETEEESDFFLASDSGHVGCGDCVPLYCAPPATPQAAPVAAVASNAQILKGYELGFLRGAEWVNRDDLRADLDSGAYAKDRDQDLGPMPAQAAPVAAAPQAFGYCQHGVFLTLKVCVDCVLNHDHLLWAPSAPQAAPVAAEQAAAPKGDGT